MSTPSQPHGAIVSQTSMEDILFDLTYVAPIGAHTDKRSTAMKREARKCLRCNQSFTTTVHGRNHCVGCWKALRGGGAFGGLK